MASAISTPLIFASVRGILSQTFVDKIPSHINKAEFFDSTCKQHNIIFETSGSEMFSFEGQWNDFLCVEEFLQKQLMDWYFTNRSPKSVTDNNDSCLICQPTETLVGERNLTAFEVSTSTEVQSDSNPNNQVIVTDIESQGICSEIIVPQENQCIQLVNRTVISENDDHNNLNIVGIDKNSLDHENEIYMDIQLSCRPPNGLFKDSGDTQVSVVMGTEESLIDAVCLESANNDKVNFNSIRESKTVGKNCNDVDYWKKLRSRKYEEKAQFKYFCTHCSFKSKRQSHLRKHSLLHEKVCELYSCDHCDFSTIRLGHLQRHVLQHSELQFTCPDCNYKTHSKSLLQKHQNLKHKVNKLSPAEVKPQLCCSECSYSTTKEKLFQRHQTVHMGDKNTKKERKKYFECSKCLFKTTMKSNLARHSKNVHMDDRPFLCNVCGQGFKRSDTLSQHLIVHAGSDSSLNDLQCPHCQKFYRSKTLLHEHMLVHLDSRSYLCEICGAAFKTRAVQRKHVRYVHSSSKSYSCNHCSKKFNSNYAVKRHMKLHESKTSTEDSIKVTQKSSENTTEVSDQWESSVMTLPIPEDVQVLVVEQDDEQQGVIFNEGAIFVQGSAEVQMESTSDPSKAVNMPVLPVEYVLPEVMASQMCTTADLSEQFSIQDGEVITLQFVQ